MGRRNHKEKQAKNRSVDDLQPFREPVVKLIRNPMRFPGNVSFNCVSKMWKTTSRRCGQTQDYPWLVLPHHENNRIQHILTTQWSIYWWMKHRCFWEKCTCCSHGKQDGQLIWTKEEYSLVDPNSSHNPLAMQFTNVIAFKGTLYVMSLQGTLATIDIESLPRLKILGVGRAIPSTWSRGYREYLVDFCGEILMVFLIYKKSMNIVDHIEVCQLDLSRISWIKMVSLGDHALFVSLSGCVGIPATELGYRRNCIYFIHSAAADGWWMFDMEDGSMVCTDISL